MDYTWASCGLTNMQSKVDWLQRLDSAVDSTLGLAQPRLSNHDLSTRHNMAVVIAEDVSGQPS